MDDDFPKHVLIGIDHNTNKPFIAGCGDTDDEALTDIVREQAYNPDNRYKIYELKNFNKRKNWKRN
ncbi:MAG: hypothetical protein WC877_00600 [Dehalococcoidales bacterium]|jgi:hypothetical protein